MAMLEIKDLHVHYGVIEALKGISLEVNEGEIVALIGANGAGKTTMIKLIVGILDFESGEILINKQNIKDIAREDLRKNVAIVLQDTVLFWIPFIII